MTNTICIRIDRADGSLQRLIGLIERRGFHIDHMTLSDSGAEREVRVRVRPRDEARCIDVLGRQIDRLFGASRVTEAAQAAPVFEPEVEPCAA